ncbi:probable malonyl-CoA-acyl carrier protein transacylase, mitochondrial isoform X2 [Sitodiplosis mosellana]|uniref:probable malonyl-CoA-acyl carrier protein transacylase, mitochondrial isoform X2 n=1 Tax=Sitodiplosis mosellana TaxID=263140 RepID=UPI0024451582|nr:probable malonyl-CoA-acyl carrier protein transacylase, mitochondrial isoform X2 [Sitodiplosis mosellana]
MMQRQIYTEVFHKVKLLCESRRFFSSTKNDTENSENRRRFLRQSQGLKRASSRPDECPDNPTIVLFPGQGAQFVGMAKSLVDIPEARDLFDIASTILRYDLLKLCNEGPEQKLNKTVYCQPAIMVTSLACLELLKKHRPDAIESCIGTAGFSLGEITSLVFAGALPYDQAIELVRVRAEEMQLASDKNKGGMATILYKSDKSLQLSLACEKAREWCFDAGVENPDCVIANHLFPQCKVISGSEEALRYISQNLKTYNLDKMKRIPAYGAFHSALMESAVEPFAKALKKMNVEDPIISVYSNTTARRYESKSHILKQLPTQIVRPVKWEQTLHVLYELKINNQFPDTFVCGPGTALKTILKQVNAKANEKTFKIGD